MSTSLRSWLWTAWFAVAALADLDYAQKSQLCASGCGYALFAVSFNGMPAPEVEGTAAPIVACMNPLWIQSMFYCSTLYCRPDRLHGALAAQNASCMDYVGMPLPPYSAPNLNNVTMITQQQAMSMTFKQPVVPDRALYLVGYHSFKNFNYAQYTNWDFVWGLYGFWGLVLIIGIGNRILYLSRNFTSSSGEQIEGASNTSARQGQSLMARSSAWYQRKLAIPFAFGSKGWIPAGYCSLPTRLETCLIVFYAIVNFVFCFPGYHLLYDDTYLSMRRSQLAKYIANRLGSLAIANIPVVWLFAARNDPLLWLTGWSYTTYSQFHRWSARILLTLIIGHGIANSLTASYSGHMSYEELLEQVFVQWGIVAITSLSILVGTSFFFMRNKAYDLWLIIHIVFAIIVIIAVFFHTKEEAGHYNGFLWFAVAIWALDRTLRLARILYVNLLPATHGAKAVAHYDADTDMIRVDVTPFFSTPPAPGSYYYLYEPARLRGYESHPFSLCSWPSTPTPRISSNPIAPSLENEKTRLDSSSSSPPSTTSSNSPGLRHTFLIKPRKGFTARLRSRATHSSTTEEIKSLHLLLEGPYGPDFHLEKFPRVVLVVGGSGISAAVSRVHHLLADGRGTRVKLVWVAREETFVRDVLDMELGAALGNERLGIEVYITGTKRGAGEEGKDEGISARAREGRPDVYEVLREERVGGVGPLAVMVCGPPQLEEGARKAVGRLLGEKGGERVVFFGERFGW